MRLVALLLAVTACASDGGHVAFGILGEVADQTQAGSTIGLFTVTTPSMYTFKFGNGSASNVQFGLEFRTDPPPDAIDGDGIGVALIANLPGISTVPDGPVELADLRLIGLSTDSAVIFRTEGAVGPTWSEAFPVGFSCGQCVRLADAPDQFAPIDCTFVVIERAFDDPCVWY